MVSFCFWPALIIGLFASGCFTQALLYMQCVQNLYITYDWKAKLELLNLLYLDYIGSLENTWHSQKTTWHSIRCIMRTTPDRHSHKILSLVHHTLRLKCTCHSDQEAHENSLSTMKFISFNTWLYMYLENYMLMQFLFGRFALQVYIYLRMVVQSMCYLFEQGCQVF